MDVGVAFPADAQSPRVVQPREGALDHPAPAARPGAVLGLPAGDQRLDPAVPELAAVLVVVRAAIGNEDIRALARPARLAGDRADAVDQRQQWGDVVAVGAGVTGQQRDALGVDDRVVLGPGAAAVNRRGPGQSPLSGRECGWNRRSLVTSRACRRR
jgi:hypothetical protein